MNTISHDAGSLIRGNQVNLTAHSGDIGASGQFVRLDSANDPSGGLVAHAAADIIITETSNDLYLIEAISLGGNVNIQASGGSILDNNPLETIDERAKQDLLELWDQMLLLDDGDDILLGGTGNDDTLGGKGIDNLEGGPGDDRLDGGHDDDCLWGEEGNDELMGYYGDEWLFGRKATTSSTEVTATITSLEAQGMTSSRAALVKT